jgi:hypothetical protein
MRGSEVRILSAAPVKLGVFESAGITLPFQVTAVPNTINAQFPTADALLAAPEIEIERAVLRLYQERDRDQFRRMTTPQSIGVELFEHGGYAHDIAKRNAIDRAISRAARRLEDAGLIEEPDSYNGKNGYRVISDRGRSTVTNIDLVAAKIRNQFPREAFHPSLPDAAWNSFRVGDYDTAVFETYKGLESATRRKAVGRNGITDSDFGVALMLKAFDPKSGPLSNMSASETRRKRRCELFTGAFGEVRNPKAHGDPTISDPLVAVEEMMMAGMLQRIVDAA